MFFPDRIISIKPGERVLEVGPGATPHKRSDVLLEYKFSDAKEYARQFGSETTLKSSKPVVYYSGKRFPFANKEFDYVICAQVLEHVPDVTTFVSELFRVAKKGYLEYPTIYYEYLYNFDVHLNFLKMNNGVLRFMKKGKTGLDVFRPVQKFFHASLDRGYTDMVDDLVELMMEGFEWDKPFQTEATTSVADLCPLFADLPSKVTFSAKRRSAVAQLKGIICKAIRKIA